MKYRVAKKYLKFSIPCAHLHCTKCICEDCVEYDEECKLDRGDFNDWNDWYGVCYCKCYKPRCSLSITRISEKQEKIAWKKMMQHFHK
jgi:hypothetical protein